MAATKTQEDLSKVQYGKPSLLILGDNEAALQQVCSAVARSSGRLNTVLGLEEALDRLQEQVGADAILVELEKDGGKKLDLLLDRLNAAASAGAYPSIVSGPPELIDPIAARTAHPAIIHLCEPTDEERLAAIETACFRGRAKLHDIGREDAAPRLHELSQEVERIANILADLSEDSRAKRDTRPDAEITVPAIRAIIRARRLREQYFGAGLFADPAWDMLLDLMAARLDRQRVAVSSLCIAAAVPATTALRWIKALTDEGLFVRVADPQDGRRVFIELSDEAAARLTAYLKTVQRMAAMMI